MNQQCFLIFYYYFYNSPKMEKKTYLLNAKRKVAQNLYCDLLLVETDVYSTLRHYLYEALVSKFAQYNQYPQRDQIINNKNSLPINYAKFLQAFKKENYQQSLDILHNSMLKQYHINNHIITYNIAITYCRTQQQRKAGFYFQLVLKEKPTFQDGIFAYCKHLYQIGRIKQALQILKRNITSSLKNSYILQSLYLKIAGLCMNTASQKDALKLFHNRPINLVVAFNLGLYFKKIKQIDKAYEIFSKIEQQLSNSDKINDIDKKLLVMTRINLFKINFYYVKDSQQMLKISSKLKGQVEIPILYTSFAENYKKTTNKFISQKVNRKVLSERKVNLISQSLCNDKQFLQQKEKNRQKLHFLLKKQKQINSFFNQLTARSSTKFKNQIKKGQLLQDTKKSLYEEQRKIFQAQFQNKKKQLQIVYDQKKIDAIIQQHYQAIQQLSVKKQLNHNKNAINQKAIQSKQKGRRKIQYPKNQYKKNAMQNQTLQKSRQIQKNVQQQNLIQNFYINAKVQDSSCQTSKKKINYQPEKNYETQVKSKLITIPECKLSILQTDLSGKQPIQQKIFLQDKNNLQKIQITPQDKVISQHRVDKTSNQREHRQSIQLRLLQRQKVNSDKNLINLSQNRYEIHHQAADIVECQNKQEIFLNIVSQRQQTIQLQTVSKFQQQNETVQKPNNEKANSQQNIKNLKQDNQLKQRIKDNDIHQNHVLLHSSTFNIANTLEQQIKINQHALQKQRQEHTLKKDIEKSNKKIASMVLQIPKDIYSKKSFKIQKSIDIIDDKSSNSLKKKIQFQEQDLNKSASTIKSINILNDLFGLSNQETRQFKKSLKMIKLDKISNKNIKQKIPDIENQQNKQFLQKFHEGQSLQKQRFYDVALEHFTRMYKQFKSDSEKYQILMHIASNFQAKNDHNSAQKTLLKCCQFGKSQAFVKLGMLQISLGRISQGVENLEKANCIDRFNTDIQTKLIYGYSLNPKTADQAYSLAHSVLRRQPQSLQTLIMTANILQKKGRIKQALEIVKAIDKSKDSVDIKYYSGLLYLNDSNVAEAYKFFSEALKMQPNHVPSLIQIGTILSEINSEQAIAILQKALSIQPQNQLALARLGKIYQSVEKDYENAMETYKKALHINQNYDSYIKIGDCFDKKGMHMQAYVNYKQAANIKKTPQINIKLALNYQKQKQYKKAYESYQNALTLLQQQANDSIDKKKCLIQCGKMALYIQQYQNCIVNLNIALQLQESEQIYTYLGDAYYGKMEYSDSLLHYQKALQLNQGEQQNWGLLEKIAMCFDRKQQYLASKAIYQKIIEKNPDSINCINNLANILLIIGNTNEAFYWFQSLLTKNPSNIQKRLRIADIYATVGDWSKVQNHLLICYKQKDNDIRVIQKLLNLYKEKRDMKLVNKFQKKFLMLRAHRKQKTQHP